MATITAGMLLPRADVPALTSTFVPSTSCTVNIYNILDEKAQCVAGTVAAGCYYYQLGVSTSTSDCFPSGWEPTSTAYFSPGICPSGYTTACSSVVSSGAATETRATCCPKGYSCQTGTDWPWFSTDLCEYKVPSTVTFQYTTSIVGQGVVTTSHAGGGQQAINAFGVQIRWQSTDFVSTTSTASTSASTGSSNSPAQTQTSGAQSDAPSSAPAAASDGLPTGAKAGIGVGVALVVLLLLAGVALLWRRRRSQKAAALPANPMYEAPTDNGYLPYQSTAPKNELDATNTRSELDSHHSPTGYDPHGSTSPGPTPYSAYPQQQNPQELRSERPYAELAG
ncbi:hypothetical protein GQ53DRAFT_757144 [Thozetella sp. PMI_491]|nr:hypothetical protein GQ53DRAFT_757144 [Thozetella sp. PMI_491]